MTGQQRFALEIGRRLASSGGTWAGIPATGRDSRASGWASAQALTISARRDRLVSLTARAPLHHPRHVVTIHDVFPVTHPEWYSKDFASVYKRLLKWQSERAAIIVTVSESSEREIRDVLGYQGQVVIAPNAASEAFSLTMSEESRFDLSKYSVEPGAFIFAVGSLDPRKNFPALIRAYSRLQPELRSQFPLLVAGERNDRVFSTDADLQGDGTIRFLGYVSDDDLIGLYKGASLVAIPSLDEGFGLPLVEAICIGSPIVCSDIPVFNWVLSKAGAVVRQFDPASVEQLTAVLQDQLLLGDLVGHARKPAAANARQFFDWDRSARLVQEAVLSV